MLRYIWLCLNQALKEGSQTIGGHALVCLSV
jgi:hypothetical protein